jgi:cytochrome c oxidase assembly protein subunit 15
MKNTAMRNLGLLATAMTLLVIVLGAYVRLSDAGLGCPDWPGCYGHIGVPDEAHEIAAANLAHPERQVEAPKAWKEMIHRYVASSLGLVILSIAGIAWKQRKTGVGVFLPTTLVGVVIFQGMLGMWTVTMLVQPIIVTAHLIGGMTTLGLLCWLVLSHSEIDWQGDRLANSGVKKLALVTLLALVLQIFLGGWTSTNYAALACYGFPTCSGEWVPAVNLDEAFTLWREVPEGEYDFEGGVISHPASVAIQIAHRLGAILATLFIAGLAHLVMFRSEGVLKKMAIFTLVALIAQLSLGIGNVFMSLPLWMATAHNGGAAILLLCVLSLVFAVSKGFPVGNEND